jgi:AbrB family looped-hinge helix DNA binding protein
MAVTIDGAGRVVIPQALRRRLGLRGGTKLDIEEVDGAIVLRPSSRVRMEIADDGLPILHAPEGSTPLTTDEVRRLVEESREWPRH